MRWVVGGYIQGSSGSGALCSLMQMGVGYIHKNRGVDRRWRWCGVYKVAAAVGGLGPKT